MLISIALILILGMAAGWVCKKIKLPGLIGMLIVGIIIGPHLLNLIDQSILDISASIRRIALIIILIRAGLKLSASDLAKAGRPAILLCFVPACLEIIGMLLLAPRLLGLSLLEAAILGSVIAAVSPAVIVPKMINLIDNKYGTNKGIPQMILAGASVDDVFVIVLFYTFTGLASGKSVNIMSFVNIPISILIGIAIGLLCGYLLHVFFKFFESGRTVKVLIIISVCFILVSAEDKYSSIIPFSSLIAVMSLGLMLKKQNQPLVDQLSSRFDRVWIPAEVFLFVLVGASVQIESALSAGPATIILLLGVMLFRMLGVFICTLASSLNIKERCFCMLAYTPKATVQAAIGALPLQYGLSCGNTVLTVSVIAILLTAPLGAFAIDLCYKKLLSKG